MGAQMKVELVQVALLPGGDLGYVVSSHEVLGGEKPNETARRVAPVNAAVVHSTSWRTGDDAEIILTYTAAPCPATEEFALLDDPAVARSGDARDPGPLRTDPRYVAAHAVRHLAYLAVTDPDVTAAAADDEPFWSAVEACAARTAHVIG